MLEDFITILNYVMINTCLSFYLYHLPPIGLIFLFNSKEHLIFLFNIKHIIYKFQPPSICFLFHRFPSRIIIILPLATTYNQSLKKMIALIIKFCFIYDELTTISSIHLTLSQLHQLILTCKL